MTAPRPHVAIRVDASVTIGSGHAMRCLALADELRSRGAVVRFVCRHVPDGLARRIVAHGHAVARLPRAGAADRASLDLSHSHWLGVSQAEDATATAAVLQDVARWDWLVVDHYGLDARFETPLRRAAERILAVDDLADRRHEADAVLDSGCLSAEKALQYEPLLPANCRRLFGPSYAFLRPDFRGAHARRHGPAQEAPFRVNVSFGGIDPPGATLVALRAVDLLSRNPGLIGRVDVVLGSASPHLTEVEAACARIPDATLHVDATEVADLLARADLALGAGGVMAWERCATGVPSIAIAIADNQRSVCATLASSRAALDAGDLDRATPERLADVVQRLLSRPTLLARMSRRAAALVDGRGAERVALFMLRGPVALRPASPADARQAWLWRNHPVSRRYSVDRDVIPWETHEGWWTRSLASPARRLLVATSGGSDLGVLRFDVEGDEAVVSIYLDPALGGLGLGTVVLREGTAWVYQHLRDVRVIRAVILPENQPSVRSFNAAGYIPGGSDRDWILSVERRSKAHT